MRATLRIVDRDNLVQRAAELGKTIRLRIQQLMANHHAIEGFGGDGLFWILKLRGPEYHRSANWHGDGPAPTFADRVVAAAMARGVLVKAYGALGLALFAPLIVDADDLEALMNALDLSLEGADRLIVEA